MNRKTPMLAFLLLVVFQLACGRTSASVRREERENQAATREAEMTQTAAVQPVVTGGQTTPTPECKTLGLFNCRPTRTPRPTTTPFPTPAMPTVLRNAEVTAGGWSPYFEDPSDIARYRGNESTRLGLVRQRFELPIVEESDDVRGVKFVLVGFLELVTLDLEQFRPDRNVGARTMVIGNQLFITELRGETGCETHDWDHDDQCHGHFWVGERHVASIPRNLDYVFVSATYVDPSFLPDVFTQAQRDEYAWYVVPIVDGKVELRFTEPVWLRAGDAK